MQELRIFHNFFLRKKKKRIQSFIFVGHDSSFLSEPAGLLNNNDFLNNNYLLNNNELLNYFYFLVS